MAPTNWPWQAVAETGPYLAQAENLLSEEERDAIGLMLAKDPTIGVVMPGTGGVRKVRVALRGRGKSGGARVVYFFHNASMPLYLMAVFAKNEKANLSKAERNLMAKVTAAIVAAHTERQQKKARR